MSTLLDIGQKPYNHYGSYLKKKYNGQRVYKVIVDGNLLALIVMEVRGMAVVHIVMWIHLHLNLHENYQQFVNRWKKALKEREKGTGLINSLSISTQYKYLCSCTFFKGYV
ncbi:hypothetical protein L950_0230725 [Sphingobacterium sp. IITKGP-BTPF85]|nr:hypothetical protein L950_0230725 [Sphingobacterium sp. IITKGP-BTPF85]